MHMISTSPSASPQPVQCGKPHMEASIDDSTPTASPRILPGTPSNNVSARRTLLCATLCETQPNGRLVGTGSCELVRSSTSQGKLLVRCSSQGSSSRPLSRALGVHLLLASFPQACEPETPHETRRQHVPCRAYYLLLGCTRSGGKVSQSQYQPRVRDCRMPDNLCLQCSLRQCA